MVDKYSKAEEQEKHGHHVAYERYGRPRYLEGAPPPKGSPFPKDPEGRPGAKNFGDIPENSWLRGGKPAESKPGYYRSKR